MTHLTHFELYLQDKHVDIEGKKGTEKLEEEHLIYFSTSLHLQIPVKIEESWFLLHSHSHSQLEIKCLFNLFTNVCVGIT